MRFLHRVDLTIFIPALRNASNIPETGESFNLRNDDGLSFRDTERLWGWSNDFGQ